MLIISFLLPVIKPDNSTPSTDKTCIITPASLVSTNETIPDDVELIFSEDFEQLLFPPNGWEQSITNPDYTWYLDDMYAHTSNYSACCLHDVNASYQDEWIITPNIDMSNHSDEYLCFNFFMSYFWSVYPYDNYDLNVYVSKENESNWHLIWNEEQTEPFENWNWINTSKNEVIDLSEYADDHVIQLGFQYNGSNGAQLNIDDIFVYGSRVTNPPTVDAGGPFEAYVGEEIEFLGNVTGGEAPFIWSWDFGDGIQSSNKVTTHAFDKIGNYTIRLQVTDANGITDSDITTAQITNMSKVPELIITNITGSMGVHAVISNQGCIDAQKIIWEIQVYGGILDHIANIDNGNISCLKQKCCCEIKSSKINGFGLVDIAIFVDAKNMHRISKRCKGFLIGEYLVV